MSLSYYSHDETTLTTSNYCGITFVVDMECCVHVDKSVARCAPSETFHSNKETARYTAAADYCRPDETPDSTLDLVDLPTPAPIGNPTDPGPDL